MTVTFNFYTGKVELEAGPNWGESVNTLMRIRKEALELDEIVNNAITTEKYLNEKVR
jgi:hypothetical protein